MQLIEQVKAARRVNTPLLLILTQDQPATQTAIAQALNGNAVTFAWDAVRGLRPANEPAVEWLKGFLGVADANPQGVQAAFADLASKTGNPNAVLDFAQNLPAKAVLFQTNAGCFWSDPVTQTAVLNLRETFKKDKRTLIGTDPGFDLPPSLQSSVVLIDEPLASDEECLAILDKLYQGANPPFPVLTDEQRREAVTAVRGLSAFMVEQTFAMSLEKGKGLNLDECWSRKRVAFNQTPGLTLEEAAAGPTFKDIEGLAQIQKRERAHFAGKNAAAVIVRIEEIEKAFAGIKSDSSGVSQGVFGYVLDFMEEKRCTGFVALGPGGSGKSLVSKALGREFRRPVVTFDVKALEDKLVGESPRKARNALKAIGALAGGAPVLFVATCNGIDALPPELKRRFTQGLWFFDLPTEAEREAIWKLYLKKHGLSKLVSKALDFAKRWANWTGAEIRNCVETVAFEGVTVDEAAEYVVPVAEADPEALRKLRTLADDRFLSASYPGKYHRPDAPKAQAEADGGRTINLNE